MGLLSAGSITLDSTFNSLASILFFIRCFLCYHTHRWNIGKNVKYANGMFQLVSCEYLSFSQLSLSLNLPTPVTDFSASTQQYDRDA